MIIDKNYKKKKKGKWNIGNSYYYKETLTNERNFGII